MDILRDAPIMNLIGNEFQGIEGDEYVKAIVAKLGFDTRTARNIYYHIRGNDIKKASVLAIPSVLEKG